ncbi:Activating signal cointegrator 1 complex subunit 1 [Amphibalanus amphitrite]|uniref:Activating signal cointegrator 1 complex subunit 1 n=1 Tax=Amphibalanus amphitrite TaxID=1232801 RepID=A0A6A4W8E6_AMPAM|nr:activating signal cointegrator 1 complex subunit 1-like [Amphibalanus amphitrite]XP_043206731.1 activating signal cointegrator 1 complex subunit 1-like [Amphibalanus amphitrite]XP_043206738.1 activating signal cointegrator 1 complex subunit 1-like [Amphibalanus amphitrite]XP_043206746.1 activating signal cointegrator 1 complex subunit 1-like [Amphibalanus amphitrite]XP_043206755.1 activating signal cointegrator 1 complex subunit 1-like [Amphibalanus amphitrite]XP_043206759.1 activating sign
MDVLRPNLVWVDGACYRVSHSQQAAHQDEDPEDFIRGDEDTETEEVMSSAVKIEEWKGKYKAELDIPSALYGFLIGRKGNSLRLVRDNTGCKVTVPKGAGPRTKPATVEVIGEQRRAVVRACNMLLMSADRGRQTLTPSHFIAVRLTTQHVQNRMETFKKSALEVAAESRGVRPELFQDGRRLHLTLVMATLLSDSERTAFCRALNNHADELRGMLPPSGLSLRVRQLDIMNDDESEARVVFARVHEGDGSGAMQRLADRCMELAYGTGLSKKEYDHVKLHCTVMNVSFLVKNMDESSPEYAKLRKSTFDATAIMKELKEFDFGTVKVEQLEVVQRHTPAEDGFYLPIGAVSLGPTPAAEA